MRNFILMLFAIAAAGLLAGSLAACSVQETHSAEIFAKTIEPDNPDAPSAPSEAPEDGQADNGGESSGNAGFSGNPEPSENDGPSENSAPSSESSASPSTQQPGAVVPHAAGAASARREAFAALLRTAHDKQTLPDGSALGGNSTEDIEGNLFTVYDVDGDGQEELVLIWTNTITAGMMELVYGYDDASGKLQEELREFPGVIFYNNGVVECPWSHNQGLAGEFWPYNLYQYDAKSGKYESVGSVDAWDSGFNTDIFPKDADADGNGMVYYLLPSNWDGQYNAPVDDAEYIQWRDNWLKGADFLELSFVPLTEKNIAQALDNPAS